MPRFVDRKPVRSLDLGPCECPVEPKPHENDYVHFREFRSYTDRLAEVDAGARGLVEYNRVRLQQRLKGWNLVGEDGKPLPATYGSFVELSPEVGDKIQGFLNELDNDQLPDEELPNG